MSMLERYRGETLTWQLRGAVCEVELHREPCNEIGTTTLAELEMLVENIKVCPPELRVLIFSSSVQRGFCAGADLRELYQGILHRRANPSADVRSEVQGFVDRIHRVFSFLDTSSVTTIAALHGFCFGGGFELVLTCDLVIADKSTRFCFPELRLGLIPGFGGIPRLKREVSNAVIRDLLLTGRSIGAERAHALGLVSQVVGRGEALASARLVAEQHIKLDGHAAREAKRFLKPSLEAELEEERNIFLNLITSKKIESALRYFVESEDPFRYLG